MVNSISEVSLIKLKTAIALVLGRWIGVYSGNDGKKMFTSVPQIFDLGVYSDELWRFEAVPLIFDEEKLDRIPAIWVRGGDPPNEKISGGIEVIISSTVRGLRNTPRPEWYQVELNNYDETQTMHDAIDALKNSWHPMVQVLADPTYIERAGIYNERCVARLIRGIGGRNAGF